MRYNPSYRYSGTGEPNHPVLQNLTDSFHFTVRAALRGRRLVAKGGVGGPLWLNQSNDDLRTKGWFIGEMPLITAIGPFGRPVTSHETANGIFSVDDEGRGLVVSPIMYATGRYYYYIANHLPAAMAAIA